MALELFGTSSRFLEIPTCFVDHSHRIRRVAEAHGRDASWPFVVDDPGLDDLRSIPFPLLAHPQQEKKARIGFAKQKASTLLADGKIGLP
jgi:hypothetical protein